MNDDRYLKIPIPNWITRKDREHLEDNIRHWIESKRPAIDLKTFHERTNFRKLFNK